MNVIIVGSGRLGSELAYRLFLRGDHVTVLDRTATAFNSLAPDFRGRTLEGDVLSAALLHRAGIEKADALAAVTSSDSLNAVVGRVAVTVYGVRHVVIRNYDPRWRPLLEAFGLQVVSSSTWGAQRIEEMLTPGVIQPLLSAGNGEVEICELVVPESWHGRPVQDLATVSSGVVAALTRAGFGQIPALGTLLETGDVVHISATPLGLAALRQSVSG
ncbi:MAG: TrkA family potassium uptake protein [Anaerolineae bacterium]|nr:TrkA family potassium uptake protein [Anaerolineae bacterium]